MSANKKDFRQDDLTSATGSLSIDDEPWIEQYLKGTSKKIKVETITLDQIVGKDKMPALIKIDVEGHESEVLEGGQQTIKVSKPIMIIESFPPKQERVVKTLDKIGYKIYDADRLSLLENKTCNLFAWHPDGPIRPSKIENLLSMKERNKVPLSLLIPCKNEEINIERCLKSVDWIEERFVVDSQSTDKTGEIADSLGAKVVQFEYQGGWPKKKTGHWET